LSTGRDERGAAALSFVPMLVSDPINANTPGFERKICAPATLPDRLSELARPLVFTNGCFDILHRGHVTYLAQARAHGASLLVALNTDASVRRQGKAGDRTVNLLEDRLAVVAALQAVDLVTWFDDDTPRQLILSTRPDVLVKGGDWPREKIVGAAEVLSWDGQVHSIPFLFDRSTTATLARIRRAAS
jgi:D-glycero-beta-D-manno-heptose 1-phosphate adenylyltransferase